VFLFHYEKQLYATKSKFENGTSLFTLLFHLALLLQFYYTGGTYELTITLNKITCKLPSNSITMWFALFEQIGRNTLGDDHV
jgi:hypothetical protein